MKMPPVHVHPGRRYRLLGRSRPATPGGRVGVRAECSGPTRAILNLSGGNDALSMLVPYEDPFYYSRRPTLAVPAGAVLPLGTDAGGHVLGGLHPALTGLSDLFHRGSLAVLQRVGYATQTRSHFIEQDILAPGASRLPSARTAGWAATSTPCRPIRSPAGPPRPLRRTPSRVHTGRYRRFPFPPTMHSTRSSRATPASTPGLSAPRWRASSLAAATAGRTWPR